MEVNEKFMRRALQLAKAGRGFVSPNPMVGAVVVGSDGQIIGEGYHRQFGGPHAEVNAIAAVADPRLLAGATLYVTLEPCSHYGKTPPCAKMIIDKGIRRVAVGASDPFPRVRGRGVATLRQAGVEVVEGVLAEECEALNVGFMTAHKKGRPHVLLKWAQSSDRYLDGPRREPGGKAAQISTPLTLTLMHRLRAAADAILVGAGTARLDDPSLTARLWPCRRQPLRVLLDRDLSAPAGRRLLADGRPTIVYNSLREGTDGAVTYAVAADLRDILADLYSNRAVTSLMVEGGANVLRQFIDAGLWDQARVETGPEPLAGGTPAPVVKGVVTRATRHGGNTIEWIANSVK